jgi:hypothetical protein
MTVITHDSLCKVQCQIQRQMQRQIHARYTPDTRQIHARYTPDTRRMPRWTHAYASEDPNLLIRLYRRSARSRFPPRRVRHHPYCDSDRILSIAIGVAGRDRAGEAVLGFVVNRWAFYWEGSAVRGQ